MGRYWVKIALQHFRDHGGVCRARPGWGSHDLRGVAYRFVVMYPLKHSGYSRGDSDTNVVTCVLDDRAHVGVGLCGRAGGPFPVRFGLLVDRAL